MINTRAVIQFNRFADIRSEETLRVSRLSLFQIGIDGTRRRERANIPQPVIVHEIPDFPRHPRLRVFVARFRLPLAVEHCSNTRRLSGRVSSNTAAEVRQEICAGGSYEDEKVTVKVGG